MNIKQHLYKIRAEQKELAALQYRIVELRSSLGVKGMTYDGISVQSSHDTDPLAEKFGKIDEYEQQLVDLHRDLTNRRIEAQDMINKLDDPIERTTLELFFLSIERMSMEDIGERIGYERAQTYRIYTGALKKLNMILNDT